MQTESVTARRMTVEPLLLLAVFYGTMFFVSFHCDILDERRLFEVVDINSDKSQNLFFDFIVYPSDMIASGIETILDTAKTTETHKFGVRSKF